MTSSSNGSPAKTAGAVRPPIPLAVSATTRSGRNTAGSTKECTWVTKTPSASSRDDTVPATSTDSRPATVMSRISVKPVSAPIGFAPARHNFTPLYCAGLCEAVSMAPGISKWPAAKKRRSVEASPKCTTSMPCPVAPRANASAKSGPDGRMSWAINTDDAPDESAANRANAAPMRSIRAASS